MSGLAAELRQAASVGTHIFSRSLKCGKRRRSVIVGSRVGKYVSAVCLVVKRHRQCKQCGQRATVKIDDLIRMYGPERNVRSIGQDALDCPDKRLRREGEQCPITYHA